MSTTIKANVSSMFATIEPREVSGSQAELGDSAGRLTWRNALSIVDHCADWLESEEKEACEAMTQWARETGAWTAEEIKAWTKEECLALFVQNVASELRMLGADEDAGIEPLFEACAEKYANTDWNSEPEYPIGCYYMKKGSVFVSFYTGI